MNIRTWEKMALEGQYWKDWYAKAAEQIKTICTKNGWDCGEFIDILSLTSPRVHVKRNLRIALHYFREGSLPSTVWKPFVTSVEHYESTGEIRGPKTSAFADALKGNTDAVVLDVWMAAAFNVEQKVFSKKTEREKYETIIRRVAKRLGWEPRQVQAAMWASAVKQHGRNVPAYNIAEELTLWD